MSSRNEVFKRCEMLLKQFDEEKYYFFTTYGRTALYAVLSAIDVKGKEVILPALTCNTTNVSAVYQAGGRPIFVDINSNSLQMDINELREKINKNTSVVITHHYYGYWTKNVEEIDALCKENGIFHIEDCAHAIGNRKEFCSDVRIYSLSKSAPSRAGGCIVTGNVELYENIIKKFGKHSMLNEFVKNVKTNECFWSLKRKAGEKVAKRHMLAKIELLIVSKILKRPYRHVSGNFYTQKWDKAIDEIEFDICATKKQIQKGYSVYKNVLEMGKEKNVKVSEIIGKGVRIHPYCCDCCSNPMYLLIPRNEVNKLGLSYLPLWPEHQNYSDEQNTIEVKKLSDEWVAIDLFPLTLRNSLRN